MTVDVLVLGGGCAGMTAAAVANALGLRVLLCEATEQVGGMTASAGGTIWVPLTHLARAGGVSDTRENVLRYLHGLIGDAGDARLIEAFVDTGAAAIRFLEEHTELQLMLVPRHPDYRHEIPGSTVGGRALAPKPFDARLLGRAFARVRPPRPDFMAFGKMMVNRDELEPLTQPLASWSNFRRAAAILGRYALDRLRYARGTRLFMGNAIVARLYYSLRRREVPVRFETRATRLILEQGRVVGAELVGPEGVERVSVGKGVVLACGGVSGAWLGRAQVGDRAQAQRTLVFERNRGEGAALALACGAQLETDHSSLSFWMPVSVYRADNGEIRNYPHIFLDRAKPGVIAVNQEGRRFTNEADSYHDFVLAMKRQEREFGSAFRCYLLCDARALRLYGLGAVMPRSWYVARFVRSGYLRTATNLEQLAQIISVPAENLKRTVERFNMAAGRGKDEDFGRGESPLNLHNADPKHGPNPSLGALERAPFYALELFTADLAPSIGLKVDRDARVLNEGGAPIAGLYACGNDMASIMRGTYPGPGTTLGPGLVFAYRVACHLAGRSPT